MSKNLEVKKQAVSEIKDKLDRAKSLVIVEYNGLTVDQATELRSLFRAENVEYSVIKNTFLKRAANDLGIDSLDSFLEGPNAFIFGYDDEVAPARILSNFVKKTKTTAITVKAGLLGKELIDTKQIEALAALPSRDVLLARLLGSLNSTIASFVRVIEAIRKKQAGEDTAE